MTADAPAIFTIGASSLARVEKSRTVVSYLIPDDSPAVEGALTSI
jgi:hypothetical protein